MFKPHYIINHIIFDFFQNNNFFIRRMVKVGVKVKYDKLCPISPYKYPLI
jgi:hypothetical protein